MHSCVSLIFPINVNNLNRKGAKDAKFFADVFGFDDDVVHKIWKIEDNR